MVKFLKKHYRNTTILSLLVITYTYIGYEVYDYTRTQSISDTSAIVIDQNGIGLDTFTPSLFAQLNLEFVPERESDFIKTAKKIHKQKKHQAQKRTQLVHYIQKNYPISHEDARKFVLHATDNANIYKLEPELILAVIAVESTYNRRAKSKVGALGLMQIIPKWHLDKIQTLGDPEVLFNAKENIAIGSQILSEYLLRDKGNLTQALQRYNGSRNDLTQTYAKKVFNEYSRLKLATLSLKTLQNYEIASLDRQPEHTSI